MAFSIDPASLLNYFNAHLPLATQARAAARNPVSATKSATAADAPPWNAPKPDQNAQDAKVLSITDFLDTSKVPLSAGSTADSKTEQDNQKLFSLYTAINTLSYLAGMSQRAGMTPGQMAGFNTRFQQGLQQVRDFIANTGFNNITLQPGKTADSVTSTVSVPFASFNYKGGTVVSDANLGKALPGVDSSQSFDIAVTKGGTTTDVAIDLSQIQGPLTLDNIVAYANQQLQANGFSSRLSRVMTSGSIQDPSKATYGIAITPAPSEKLSLSAAASQPALYVAGNTGTATATADRSSPDQQGRLVKLANLSGGAPQGVFSETATPTNGTTTAQSTLVDAQGNVYVLGNATGDFGNELNQGSQDVYLSKYDSAGNLQWTKLVGSAGTANGASIALTSDGVVIAGSTTADLSPGAVADGNTDSFVAKYDSSGNQQWTQQIPTLASNQAASVSVDASGNIYIGGQVTGVLGAGQTSSGKNDAYVAQLSASGKIVYEQQFGTSANDQVAATATTSDGGLVVASIQNGHAIVSKYADGDARQAAEWSVDLGDLQNGALSGLTISGNQIYLAGSTQNGALTAGGAATVASAASGSLDAFVFNLTDNGTTATPQTVSYVGTSGTDRAGGVTVGSDGTVYLTGSTTGTFAGQTRNATGTNNTFVSALNPDGSVAWTTQYGGADGQSSGQAIAIDTNGASVLDALGLPRGAITLNQSVDLASQTTLRPGDSFSIDVQGTGAFKTTVTIQKGDTLQTLANRINSQLLFAGTAKVFFGNGGESLQITMKPGMTATLIAGPADSDALARLGIQPQTLSAPAAKSTSSSSSSASSANSASGSKQSFGLGLPASMDISTASGATVAKAQLFPVLAAIQNIYTALNTPPAPPAGPGKTGGTVPASLTAQIANFTTALQWLQANSSTGTTA